MSGCKCPYVTAQRGDKVNLRHLGGFSVNKVGAFNAAVLIFPARFNPSGDETGRKHADGSEVLAAEKEKKKKMCMLANMQSKNELFLENGPCFTTSGDGEAPRDGGSRNLNTRWSTCASQPIAERHNKHVIKQEIDPVFPCCFILLLKKAI